MNNNMLFGSCQLPFFLISNLIMWVIRSLQTEWSSRCVYHWRYNIRKQKADLQNHIFKAQFSIFQCTLLTPIKVEASETLNHWLKNTFFESENSGDFWVIFRESWKTFKNFICSVQWWAVQLQMGKFNFIATV